MSPAYGETWIWVSYWKCPELPLGAFVFFELGGAYREGRIPAEVAMGQGQVDNDATGDVVVAAFHTGGELAAAVEWVGQFFAFVARYDTFPPREGVAVLVRWKRRGEVPPPPPAVPLPVSLAHGAALRAFAELAPLATADRRWPKVWPVSDSGGSLPAVIAVRVDAQQVELMLSALDEITAAAAGGGGHPGHPVVVRAVLGFTGPEVRRAEFVEAAGWVAALLRVEVDEVLEELLGRLAGATGTCVLTAGEHRAFDRLADQVASWRTR